MSIAEAHELNVKELPNYLEEIAREKAKKYGINVYLFVETMRNESGGFGSTTIQSGYYHNGVRERSFGVCQFNIPSGLKTASGEEITYDIAVDPEQCLDAAAYNFSVGNANQWTEYRKLKQTDAP